MGSLCRYWHYHLQMIALWPLLIASHGLWFPTLVSPKREVTALWVHHWSNLMSVIVPACEMHSDTIPALSFWNVILGDLYIAGYAPAIVGSGHSPPQQQSTTPAVASGAAPESDFHSYNPPGLHVLHDDSPRVQSRSASSNPPRWKTGRPVSFEAKELHMSQLSMVDWKDDVLPRLQISQAQAGRHSCIRKERNVQQQPHLAAAISWRPAAVEPSVAKTLFEEVDPKVEVMQIPHPPQLHRCPAILTDPRCGETTPHEEWAVHSSLRHAGLGQN